MVFNENAASLLRKQWKTTTLEEIESVFLANATKPPTFFSNWLIPGNFVIGSQPSVEGAERLVQQGINTFVSLIGEHSFHDVTTTNYSMALRSSPHRTQLIHAPIPDFGTPSEDFLLALVAQMIERLREGERVFLHCRAGLGRTGLVSIPIVATLLRTDFETARTFVMKATRATRASHLGVHHDMPETAQQIELARAATAHFRDC